MILVADEGRNYLGNLSLDNPSGLNSKAVYKDDIDGQGSHGGDNIQESVFPSPAL